MNPPVWYQYQRRCELYECVRVCVHMYEVGSIYEIELGSKGSKDEGDVTDASLIVGVDMYILRTNHKAWRPARRT